MDRLKFPHLESLSSIGVAKILDAEYVTVTEKIDGFNARFGCGLDGKLWAGTRNREFDPETEPQQGFAAFFKTFTHPDALIGAGVTLFGEWAGKGILNRIDYGEPSFWFFDGHYGSTREEPNGGSWFDPDDMDWYAKNYDLKRPRQFHAGPPPSIDQLEEWRNTPGIEGIVIRAYPMAVDVYGHPLIAKFKSPAFSEREHERVQKAPPDMANVNAFVGDYVTEERLHHVLEGLRLDSDAADVVDYDPLDVRETGQVLRRMYEDIVREGYQDYDLLSEADQKLVGKASAMAAKVLLIKAREETLR